MLAIRSRGDTIVEVMVAFAVFSLVAVGTVTVMNRGIAAAERSLEVTLVRQQIDAQAELIRYARSVNDPVWDSIKAAVVTNPPTVSTTTCPTSPPANSFFVTTNTSTTPATLNYYGLPGNPSQFAAASVHSQFTLGTNPPRSSGLWVVAVRADTTSTATAADAYDMYINACWFAPGFDRPQLLRTIVRLHESV